MSWFGRSKSPPTPAPGPAPETAPAPKPGEDPLVGIDIPRVDFQIVGAMKCGTTTLRRALTAHPDVHLPPGEEHFFGNHRRYLSVWRNGVLDPDLFEQLYARQFRSKAQLVGGKTPNYVISMVALERLQRFHPQVKTVLMVRCPIARAQSHWNHMVRQRESGKLPASRVGPTFLDQIERDLEELRSARDPAVEIRGTNLLWRGMYAPQLLVLRHFFPAERVFVGVLEDLKSDPETFLRSLCAFLGARYDDALATAASQGESRAPDHTERLGADERTRLAEIYAPSVATLEGLLDRRLPRWLLD